MLMEYVEIAHNWHVRYIVNHTLRPMAGAPNILRSRFHGI